MPLPKTVMIDSMGKMRQWDLDNDTYCVLCGSRGIYAEADFGAGDYYTGVRNVCPKCGLTFSYQDWENDEDVLRLLKKIAPQRKTVGQDAVCSGMSVYPSCALGEGKYYVVEYGYARLLSDALARKGAADDGDLRRFYDGTQ